MNVLYGWLFGRVIRLDMSGDVPPWPMSVFNPTTNLYESVNGIAHNGGSPIVAEGLRGYPVSELLCFPGDPPDLLNFGGDVLYLRSWQPDLLTTASGDLMVAEGLD